MLTFPGVQSLPHKVKLDPDKRLPLYRRLFNSIRKNIETGELQPGDAVPSTRELADELGIGRITVITAYEELVNQGYLQTMPGRGTFVLANSEHQKLEAKKKDAASPPSGKHLSRYAKRVLQLQQLSATSADQPELNFGAPPMDLLPLKQWRKLLQKHSSIHIGKRFDMQMDPMGFRPLREALATYLSRARGLKCTGDMISVFASSQQSVNLVLRLLVDKEDAVAVENPGFVFARKTLLTLDAEPIPIDVDKDGMIVSKLNEFPACKLAYVTPSHQDPTGAIMSASRRKELLNWAARTNAFIIEDDYDSEYNYGTPPLQSLQGQDEHDSVIYVSTFWKTLYPILPVGFVVVPSNLVPLMTKSKLFSERNFSLLEQYALTDFINEGHLDRHISKTRKIYTERRRQLISSLTRAFKQSIEISKYSAGMHLMMRLQSKFSDQEVIEKAAAADLPMVSTEPYYVNGHRHGEFLVSFAGHTDQRIATAVNRFARYFQ